MVINVEYINAVIESTIEQLASQLGLELNRNNAPVYEQFVPPANWITYQIEGKNQLPVAAFLISFPQSTALHISRRLFYEMQLTEYDTFVEQAVTELIYRIIADTASRLNNLMNSSSNYLKVPARIIPVPKEPAIIITLTQEPLTIMIGAIPSSNHLNPNLNQ